MRGFLLGPWILLTLAWTLRAEVTDTDVTCLVMETCILPCSVPREGSITVRWFKDPEIVPFLTYGAASRPGIIPLCRCQLEKWAYQKRQSNGASSCHRRSRQRGVRPGSESGPPDASSSTWLVERRRRSRGRGVQPGSESGQPDASSSDTHHDHPPAVHADCPRNQRLPGSTDRGCRRGPQRNPGHWQRRR
ncbi:uncharacterized protein LOC144988402 isoform X3 [Oryzias latipes]